MCVCPCRDVLGDMVGGGGGSLTCVGDILLFVETPQASGQRTLSREGGQEAAEETRSLVRGRLSVEAGGGRGCPRAAGESRARTVDLAALTVRVGCV